MAAACNKKHYYKGLAIFTDYSGNTCPGGNKSGASVSIILSTSNLAVSCKAYTSGENLTKDKEVIWTSSSQWTCQVHREQKVIYP